MAKASAVPASEASGASSPAESAPSPDVKIIIEKYFAKKPEIDASIKRAFAVIYKGQTNTEAEWDAIISRRLSRPIG